MQISLVGIGSETLLSEFDSAGVEYIKIPPRGIMNGGETLQIIKDISGAIPWTEIAAVIIAWLKYRPSRRFTLSNDKHEIFNAKDYSPKELAAILPLCKNFIAAETEKPEKQV